MTVGAMMAEMTRAELGHWLAFAQLEPFGAAADAFGPGIVASTLANIHRDPKRRGPYEAADFMPVLAMQRESTKRRKTARQIDVEIDNVLGTVLATMKAKGRA